MMSQPTNIPERNFDRIIEQIICVIVASVSAAFLGWILRNCSRGIDFSDEGFYLNWVADPSLYKASHTQFGFIYHPLYLLLGRNLVWLRQANLLITFGLSWALFGILLCRHRFPIAKAKSSDWLAPLCLSFAFAPAAMLFLQQWITTPSYNSLALQALLIAGIGLQLIDGNALRRSGWLVVGIAGWLTFMAKPTTAAILALLLGAWLLLARRLTLRGLLLAIGTSAVLLIATAWMIDGSIDVFVFRLSQSMADLQKLDGGYGPSQLFRLDQITLGAPEKISLTVHTLLISLAICFGASPRPILNAVSSSLVLLWVTVCCVFFKLADSTLLPHLPFLGLQLLALPFGAGLATVLMADSRWVQNRRWATTAMIACLLLFPCAFAFGTNNNYWINGAWAAVFVVLASLIAVAAPRPQRWGGLLPLAAATLACTILVLVASARRPYRQTQALWLNGESIQTAQRGPALMISHDFARYLKQLHSLATGSGFHTGEPMIDLTGHYPTALYFLHARAIGLPWLCGGYAGSDEMATAALDRVPREELRKAWVLTEPEGIRALTPTILKRYGLDLVRDYVVVGTLDSPTGTYPDSYKQHLLKPAK